MWFQGLTTGTTSAVGKGGQGTQLTSASTSVKPGTPFADWLQAALLSDIPLEKLSGVNISQPVIETRSAEGELSQELLDTLLQSWLAAFVQPLLQQADAQAGSLPNAPTHPGAESSGEHSTNAMNQLHLISRMSPISQLGQGSLNALEGESLALLEQWLRGITLSSGTQPPTAVAPLTNSVGGNQDLLHLLQTFLQQQGDRSDQSSLPPFASDTLKMIRAYLQADGGQAMAGQELQTVDLDAGQQSDIANQQLNVRINEQDPLMVHLAKNSLVRGAAARSGSGPDGSSGQTQNEMAGNLQPSFAPTSSPQGIASAERSFLQWLTQTGSPAQAEAGSQSPVRDIAQPFPNVRLLLSRFDTLEGRGYEARFQLYPEQLGTVHVKLVLHQGILQAQLFVDNRLARDILEGQLQTLQQAFAQQGLQVDKIHVAIREDSLFQWHEQSTPFYQEQHHNANPQRRDGDVSSASRYQGIEDDEAGVQDLRRDRPASLHKGIDMSV